MSTKWLRPLLPIECTLEKASSGYRFLHLIVWVDIVTPEPLQEKLIEEAYEYLWSKCENLRLCIRQRDGQQWFAEMEEKNILLEIFKGKQISEVTQELERYSFTSSSGPLWKAAVVQHDTSNKYSLAFLFHHGIIDGLTTVKLCQKLVKFFDHYFQGEKPDDAELGKVCYATEVTDLFEQEKLEVVKEGKDEICKNFLKVFQVDPLMERIYLSDGIGSAVDYISESMGASDTSLLINTCKTNGVTVHSALTAALNCAFIKVYQKLGIIQDSYHIVGCHWVNLRRFLKHGDEALGSMIGEYIHVEDISDSVLQSFWKYAKSLHGDLHTNITGKETITQNTIQGIVNLQMDFETKETPFYTYHMSNYTNLKFEEGRHVKTLSFCRQNTLSQSPVCLFFVFYTFKGSLNIWADYMPGYVSKDFVRSIHSELNSVLINAISP